MSTQHRLSTIVQNCLVKANLTNQGHAIILAFSGGSDSSCLLNLLAPLQAKLDFKLIAAHLDHQWRPESAHEALKCQEICSKQNVPIILGQGKDWQTTGPKNRSKEAKGRSMRQSFLLDCAKTFSAKAILTGHHADDQLETFFIRLFRGAGTAGLSSMQTLNHPWLKPLLEVAKQDIDEYLQSNNLPFIKDPTNDSAAFLRNRIRHQLLPLLTKIDARAPQKILDCIELLRQENLLLENLAGTALERDAAAETVINLARFKLLPATLQIRCLIQFLIANQAHFTPSQTFLQQACWFLNSSCKPQHQLGKDWILQKHSGQAIVIKTTHQSP